MTIMYNQIVNDEIDGMEMIHEDRGNLGFGFDNRCGDCDSITELFTFKKITPPVVGYPEEVGELSFVVCNNCETVRGVQA